MVTGQVVQATRRMAGFTGTGISVRGRPTRLCSSADPHWSRGVCDGGLRHHEGVDYVAAAGQPVQAPISGYVTRIGYAYDDDLSFRYVEITNPALRYQARVLYVSPDVAVGQTVRLGEAIGEAQSLQRRYPGITDHVHLELARLDLGHIDATRMITARLQAARSQG